MSYAKSFEYVDAKETIVSKIVRAISTSVKYAFVIASIGLNVFLFIGVVEIEAQNTNLKFQVEYLNEKLEKALISEPTLGKFIENKINKILEKEPEISKSEEKQIVVTANKEITFEKLKNSFLNLWNMSVN